jgi:hypothetical protein
VAVDEVVAAVVDDVATVVEVVEVAVDEVVGPGALHGCAAEVDVTGDCGTVVVAAAVVVVGLANAGSAGPRVAKLVSTATKTTAMHRSTHLSASTIGPRS